MENKINIAELLKDCPKGMELDCTLFDDVKYEECAGDCIYICLNNGELFALTKYGSCIEFPISKCVIFPKGKTSWKGFQRPFKDGDIVTWKDRGALVACIYKERKNTSSFYHHIALYKGGVGIIVNSEIALMDNQLRLATEEEKQKLFDAIKANGYKWNKEIKTLEKLIKPKFKVGDIIKPIFNKFQYRITELTDTHYTLVEVDYKYKYTEPIIEDKNWTLVSIKFDINTLKPFDKVLTRANNDDSWVCNLYSHRIKDYYVVLNAELVPQCIPYDGNQHLLGTTDDCDEYYKTWE